MAYVMDVPEALMKLVQSGSAQVYGTIIKDVRTGRILGHLEETGITNIATGVMTGNPLSTVTGVAKAASSIVGNVQNQKMIKQLAQISTQLTTVTALGWANVGLSAVTLGVTAVGMIAVSKKLNNLNGEIQRVSKQLDNIDMTLAAIQLGVDSLKQDAVRNLTREYKTLMKDMSSVILELNSGRYSEYIGHEARKLLHASSSFLEDMIERYVERCEIVITMEQLISFFSVYTAYSKVVLSKTYLNTGTMLDPMEYQTPIRNMCSNNIVYTLDEQVRNSAKSVILQSDLNLINKAYTTTVTEQVKSIKSSEQAMNYLPYNEFAFINEDLKNVSNKEIAYVEYA